MQFSGENVEQVLKLSDSQSSGVPLVFDNQLFLNYSIGKLVIYTFHDKTEPIQ